MRTSTTTTGHRRNNASCPLLTPQCGQSRAARAGRTAEEWRTALNWSEPVELGAFYRYAFAKALHAVGLPVTTPARAEHRHGDDTIEPARPATQSAAARSASQRRSGVADRRGAGGPGFALAGSRATNDHAQCVRRLGAGNGRKPATGTVARTVGVPMRHRDGGPAAKGGAVRRSPVVRRATERLRHLEWGFEHGTASRH